MRRKAGIQKAPAEQVVKDIRRVTRKQYRAEEKIRIVLEGLRGESALRGRKMVSRIRYFHDRFGS